MAEDDTLSEDAQKSASMASDPEDRGNFMPLVFGGAVATVIGFFAAQIDGVERALGLAPQDNGLVEMIEQQAEQLSVQSAVIETQAGAIATLRSDLDALPEPPSPVDLPGLENRVAQAFAALEARIGDLEKRPMTQGLSPEAVEAYEAELNRMQASVAEQRAEIEALLKTARATESTAEEQAQIALARAALTRIITAVDSGKPFGDALAELDATGGADVPEALRSLAGEGVPTLASLQNTFPDAARVALSTARSESASSGEGGLGSFLQRQLGARSVTPQEGNSADAVLSRAEAAVDQGRIGDALSELDNLPDPAKAAISGWIDTAGKRQAATSAADELLTALSAN